MAGLPHTVTLVVESVLNNGPASLGRILKASQLHFSRKYTPKRWQQMQSCQMFIFYERAWQSSTRRKDMPMPEKPFFVRAYECKALTAVSENSTPPPFILMSRNGKPLSATNVNGRTLN